MTKLNQSEVVKILRYDWMRNTRNGNPIYRLYMLTLSSYGDMTKPPLTRLEILDTAPNSSAGYSVETGVKVIYKSFSMRCGWRVNKIDCPYNDTTNKLKPAPEDMSEEAYSQSIISLNSPLIVL